MTSRKRNCLCSFPNFTANERIKSDPSFTFPIYFSRWQYFYPWNVGHRIHSHRTALISYSESDQSETEARRTGDDIPSEGNKQSSLVPVSTQNGAHNATKAIILPVMRQYRWAHIMTVINIGETKWMEDDEWPWKSSSLKGFRFQVSWIRKHDVYLLTVGLATYNSDDRFMVEHVRHLQNWGLVIKHVQLSDAGLYECQVSTYPPTSILVELRVTSKPPNF